jgi:hypothetical protein
MGKKFLKSAAALAVAVAATLATVPARAVDPVFSGVTGLDAATVMTSVVENNKGTILFGMGATAFLGIVAALARKLRGGGKRVM